MADDVSLTDLEVIQRYSLAVRGATASRADLVQTLSADLAWLTGRAVRLEDDSEDERVRSRSQYRVAPGGPGAGTPGPARS